MSNPVNTRNRTRSNGGFDIHLANSAQLAAQLQATNMDANKIITAAIKDTQSRAPAQVSKAVRAVYGISSADMVTAGKAARGDKRAVGSVRVQGHTVASARLVYEGRTLTPLHFSMKPMTRPTDGKRYKVTATIMKGQRRSLGQGVFIAEGKGGTELPFIRQDKQGNTSPRYPIRVIRTVSIPQMISNEQVNADIRTRIDGVMVERLKHHAKRAEKKRGQ